MVTSFADIIDLWGPPRSLASDIGALANTVSKWRQRDFIPPEWWKRVAAAAAIQAEKGAGETFGSVTVERMAVLAESRAVA